MADDGEITSDVDLATPTAAAQPKPRKAVVKEAISRHTEDLRSRARTKVNAYASEGKAKASGKLDEVATLIDETAASLDERLGLNIGDYAHRAAGALAGFSETLRSKDVEELLEEARSTITRNPGVAVGAAVAIGFAVARLVKASAETSDASTADTQRNPGPRGGRATGATTSAT